MEPRLVQAPISLVFSESSLNHEEYEREYHQLSESDGNAINQWLKLAKARGETAETDPVLLNLVVELHNKIDALEMFLKNEEPSRVSLTAAAKIDSIGFEYFNLADDLLEVDSEYYGRIEMPVHPKRDIGIFFKAQTKTLAKITRIHDRDEKEWGSYMTARERVLIREARENK
ncbi:MAG: hypothetical protein Q9M32_07525 [Sulfurimonas sp.]|nr:hypothetical protein [Sulfurimonas sp.]MDQ7061337.1 hypothetical protein [Sulfurimonas sp.]